MDVEQKEHLKKLYKAYEKRLRVLELKVAQKGYDADAYVLMEIEECQDRLDDLQRQIKQLESTPTIDTVLSMPISQGNSLVRIKRIRVEFDGDFDNLTPELQTAMMRAIAAIAEVPYDQIKIVRISGGSIVFHLEMPDNGAAILKELFVAKDSIISEAGIRKISVGKKIVRYERENVSVEYPVGYDELIEALQDSNPHLDNDATVSLAGHILEETAKRIKKGEHIGFVKINDDGTADITVIELKLARKKS